MNLTVKTRNLARVTVCLLAGLIALAWHAPRVEAALIEIAPVNTADPQRPQTAVKITKADGFTTRTIDEGYARLQVNAGDRVTIAGFDAKQAGASCAPNLGEGRITEVVIPSPVPRQMTVEIPQFKQTENLPAHATEFIRAERRFAGLVNRARKRQGLEPLELSTSLSEAAFVFKRQVKQKQVGCPSLYDVLGDLGWSDPMDAGSAYYMKDAWEDAYDWFFDFAMDDPNKRQWLLSPEATALGVSFHGDMWTLIVGTGCDTSDGQKLFCGLTGDLGLPPAGSGSGNGGGPGDGGKSRAPRLRLAQAKQKGKRIKLVYRIDRRAPKIVRFKLNHRGRERAMRAKKRPGRYVLRLRARGKGWARLTASFAPTGEQWRSTTLCKRVKLKRIKGKRAGRWVRAKVRNCRAR